MSANIPISVMHFLEPFRQFLDDRAVNEIVINEPEKIMIFRNSGWETFIDERITTKHLERLGIAVANYTGQQWDASHPILSGSMPDKSRIQLVRPPAVERDRISLTLRRSSPVDYDLDDFEEQGMFDNVVISDFQLTDDEHELSSLLKARKIKKFLQKAVLYRKNIVCSGATFAGKTTFMKGLVKYIPTDERLITIEDTRELILPHENQVNLLYSSTSSSKAEYNAKDLLISCLRMKPDRILLAEVRSEECMYYIASAASGHPGSITSMHAQTPVHAWENLLRMIKESKAGSSLDTDSIRRLLFITIDIILQFKIVEGKRRITHIYYHPEKKYELMK